MSTNTSCLAEAKVVASTMSADTHRHAVHHIGGAGFQAGFRAP
jgi:hypothetical protein